MTPIPNDMLPSISVWLQGEPVSHPEIPHCKRWIHRIPMPICPTAGLPEYRNAGMPERTKRECYFVSRGSAEPRDISNWFDSTKEYCIVF